MAIDYFNSKSRLRTFVSRIALKSRRDQLRVLLEYFEPLLKPGFRVLDLGTTPDTSLPDSNFFIKALAAYDVEVTLCSIEDCRDFAKTLGAEFIFYNDLLSDESHRKWDFVLSAATLEHVGNWGEQHKFVSLMQSVSTSYFLTTPNRWFPVEFHTFIPFLHWLPKNVHRLLLANIFGEEFWADEANLNLLGMEIMELFQEASPRAIHRCVHLLGIPSNHLVIGPHLDSTKS